MDPADVDVNVHPTKAEVRFQADRAVFGAVQHAVRKTLVAHIPVPQIELPPLLPTPPVQWDLGGSEGWAARRDALLGAGRERDDHTPGARPASLSFPARTDLRDLRDLEGLGPSAPQAVQLPLLRVVGQLNASYIVAEGPDGMYLIDQHAAHERVLYEQMLDQRVGDRLPIQSLLEPLLLDLRPEQAGVVAEDLDLLNALGVAIEPFGGASYLVRSVPAVLSGDDPQSALTDIIDGLMQNTDTAEASREANLITGICKRAAIKAGQPMSSPEMQELVRRLEACRSPRTCPHGRPTMIYLSAAELARQFGRV
jgi:DNA mismatch repair protein MutL